MLLLEYGDSEYGLEHGVRTPMFIITGPDLTDKGSLIIIDDELS